MFYFVNSNKDQKKKKKGALIITSAALLIFLTRETDKLLAEENLDTSENGILPLTNLQRLKEFSTN